jgi:hypothetical protein
MTPGEHLLNQLALLEPEAVAGISNTDPEHATRLADPPAADAGPDTGHHRRPLNIAMQQVLPPEPILKATSQPQCHNTPPQVVLRSPPDRAGSSPGVS